MMEETYTLYFEDGTIRIDKSRLLKIPYFQKLFNPQFEQPKNSEIDLTQNEGITLEKFIKILNLYENDIYQITDQEYNFFGISSEMINNNLENYYCNQIMSNDDKLNFILHYLIKKDFVEIFKQYFEKYKIDIDDFQIVLHQNHIKNNNKCFIYCYNHFIIEMASFYNANKIINFLLETVKVNIMCTDNYMIYHHRSFSKSEYIETYNIAIKAIYNKDKDLCKKLIENNPDNKQSLQLLYSISDSNEIKLFIENILKN